MVCDNLNYFSENSEIAKEKIDELEAKKLGV